LKHFYDLPKFTLYRRSGRQRLYSSVPQVCGSHCKRKPSSSTSRVVNETSRFNACMVTTWSSRACLLAYGIAPAAAVPKDMLRTFKSLRFGLMVGIGGGIPCPEKNIDIRLGDVVIGQPSGTSGRVNQYGRGTSRQGEGLVRKD
jgi:hypothetical protein